MGTGTSKTRSQSPFFEGQQRERSRDSRGLPGVVRALLPRSPSAKIGAMRAALMRGEERMTMSPGTSTERLKGSVNRRRLLSIAERLIEVPSPTGRAGGSGRRDGGDPQRGRVRRRAARGRTPEAPAVVARLDSGRNPGGRSSSTGTSTRSICRSCRRGSRRSIYRQRRLGHEGGHGRRRSRPCSPSARPARCPPARSC